MLVGSFDRHWRWLPIIFIASPLPCDRANHQAPSRIRNRSGGLLASDGAGVVANGEFEDFLGENESGHA